MIIFGFSTNDLTWAVASYDVEDDSQRKAQPL